MAGFEVTAESVASPFGARPEDRRARSSRAEVARKKVIDERDKRSREEIRGVISKGQSFIGDFRGRETVLMLPREVTLDGESVRKVVIRPSVNREALEEIEQQPSVEVLADEAGTMKWASRIDRTMVEGQGRSATMRIGSIFRLDIDLEA
jgi:hypothetical protein